MINRFLHREHTAYVTQPIGTVEQSLDNLRIGIGVDAHLRVGSDLTVYQRGAHGIRVSLTAIRHDPDADPAVGPEVVSLSLSNAATLHDLLGEALAQAHRIDHANDPTSTVGDAHQAPTNVIRIATNEAVEDKEDTQQ